MTHIATIKRPLGNDRWVKLELSCKEQYICTATALRGDTVVAETTSSGAKMNYTLNGAINLLKKELEREERAKDALKSVNIEKLPNDF